MRESLRRVRALCVKETLQVLRDPSSLLIAFALPILMLVIFGYGINLDTSSVKIGLALRDLSPDARSFAASVQGSPYFSVVYSTTDEALLARELVSGHIRGFLVIEEDFSEKIRANTRQTAIQVVTDGSEPNTAQFVENYARGTLQSWMEQRAVDEGRAAPQRIVIEPRFWFNPTARSQNYLIPGSIVIIMTVVGALMTSLVIAREWERGTMEALLATPVTATELLLSKLLPYYVLGMLAMALCVTVAVSLMHVPFQGSVGMLAVVSTFFLFGALGTGLLFSTITRNQFNAAQLALNAAFLPAMMLSGFIYEIASMPLPIRLLTFVFPARYFVSSLQNLFQAGDIWPILWPNILCLGAAAAALITLTALKTRRTLEANPKRG